MTDEEQLSWEIDQWLDGEFNKGARKVTLQDIADRFEIDLEYAKALVDETVAWTDGIDWADNGMALTLTREGWDEIDAYAAQIAEEERLVDDAVEYALAHKEENDQLAIDLAAERRGRDAYEEMACYFTKRGCRWTP